MVLQSRCDGILVRRPYSPWLTCMPLHLVKTFQSLPTQKSFPRWFQEQFPIYIESIKSNWILSNEPHHNCDVFSFHYCFNVIIKIVPTASGTLCMFLCNGFQSFRYSILLIISWYKIGWMRFNENIFSEIKTKYSFACRCTLMSCSIIVPFTVSSWYWLLFARSRKVLTSGFL